MSVTHCPLTGTAMGFERGGTTFGVSGKLVNSNLVMYDRATDGRCPRCSQPRSRAPSRDARSGVLGHVDHLEALETRPS